MADEQEKPDQETINPSQANNDELSEQDLNKASGGTALYGKLNEIQKI